MFHEEDGRRMGIFLIGLAVVVVMVAAIGLYFGWFHPVAIFGARPS